MTGRRAVRQWDERLSRALQFVPGHVGGRVASAQPIRRRGGTLRQASVGAVALPPDVDSWPYFTGGGQLNWPNASVTLADMGGTDGETYVALLTCVNVAPLLPSGWTSLLSGSVGAIGGGLYYRVGYIQWGAATPQEQIFTIDGSLDGTTNSGRMVVNMWGVTGHYTPAVSVTTQAAATSHPFQTPSTAWGSTWNMNAYVVPHPIGTSSASPTFDAGFSPTLVDYGEGGGYPHLADDMDIQQYDGGSVAGHAHATTRTSTNAWDSAAFAFGLT